MNTSESGIGARRWIAIGLMLGLVAACAGEPAPDPTTTTDSTVPPTTTTTSLAVLDGEEVIQRFIDIVNEPGFQGRAMMDIEMRFLGGTFFGDGEMNFRGDDFHMSMGFPDLEVSFESLAIGRDVFERTNGGPWVRVDSSDPVAPSAPGRDLELFEFLNTVEDFSYLGPETRDGQSVHRLGPPAGEDLDPADFGFDPEDNAVVDVYFWVLDSGELHEIFYDMSFEVDGARLTMLITTTMVDGTPQGLSRPGGYWVNFTSSTLPYSIGHPANWEVLEMQDDVNGDYFIGRTDEIWVFHNDFEGFSISPEESMVEARTNLESEDFECGPSFEHFVGQALTMGCEGFNEGVRIYVTYSFVPVDRSTVFEFILRREGSGSHEEAITLLEDFLNTFTWEPGVGGWIDG